MSKKDVHDELKAIMTNALLQMSVLAESDTKNTDFLGAIKLFLISIISTAAGISETLVEGGATWLYSEIETAAKESNLEFIENKTTSKNQYSISDIDSDDYPSAMNYIG